MKRSWQIVIAVGLLAILLWVGIASWSKSRTQMAEASGRYESTAFSRIVTEVAEGMGTITRVKGTLDNQQLFVTNLNGELYVLNREGTKYVKQDEPVYKIETGFEPGAENGLTGLILSWEWMSNRQLFLLYAKKQGSSGVNQILRITVEKDGEKYVGRDPRVIFTGNTQVLGAHQIQGGISLLIEQKPHLLFPIGEAYHPEYSKDPSKEAGKILLIQEDGSNPLGDRPYPQFPRLQAIGLRNSYDLARDVTKGQEDWVYMTENGPEANDRITYTPMLSGKLIDFNWDGETDSMKKVLIDGQEDSSAIIKMWETTVSPTDIIVDEVGRLFVNIFSSSSYPVKEILMGTHAGNTWRFEQVVKRKTEAANGNLLGMAQTENGDIFFGDMFDGALYRFTTWGDLKPLWR